MDERVEQELSRLLGIEVHINARNVVVEHIRELLLHRFEILTQLLYQVDVDETRLRDALRIEGRDSAEVIADLLIDRIVEKQKSRKDFPGLPNNISEEERW